MNSLELELRRNDRLLVKDSGLFLFSSWIICIIISVIRIVINPSFVENIFMSIISGASVGIICVFFAYTTIKKHVDKLYLIAGCILYILTYIFTLSGLHNFRFLALSFNLVLSMVLIFVFSDRIKNKKLRFTYRLSFLIAVSFIFICVISVMSIFYPCIDGVTYQKQGDEYFVKYAQNQAKIVCREQIYDKNVVGVKQDAFQFCDKTTELELSQSTARYEFNAFNGLVNIQSIKANFSNSYVYLGYLFGQEEYQVDEMNGAEYFTYHSLVVPPSLKTIITVGNVNDYAFYGCQNIEKVILNNTTIIGEQAFAGCTMLNNVGFGQNTRIIKKGAFFACTSMELFILNDGLTKIEDLAFSKCTKTSGFRIPSSLTHCGSHIFMDCSIRIVIDCYVSYDDIRSYIDNENPSWSAYWNHINNKGQYIEVNYLNDTSND